MTEQQQDTKIEETVQQQELDAQEPEAEEAAKVPEEQPQTEEKEPTPSAQEEGESKAEAGKPEPEKKEAAKPEKVGVYLREQREKQGYTLTDIESQIKIRCLYLEAIEKENFSVLPPRVYTVGFVRRYCNFLHLSEVEEIVQYYKRVANMQDGVVPRTRTAVVQPVVSREPEPSPMPAPEKNSIHVNRKIVTVLLVLAAAWAGIFAYSWISEKWESSQLNPLSVQTVSGLLPGQSNEGILVRVVVKEGSACALTAEADGTAVFDGTKNGGEILEFQAKEHFLMTLDNAAGIQLIINGLDMTKDDWWEGLPLRIEYTLDAWNQRAQQLYEENQK